MIIAAHQPIFLPWPGFFFKALAADALVLLDDVQFPQGRGWMTRNRLKSDKGELWLTVPVRNRRGPKQLIREVQISDETDWRKAHLRSIREAYAHAPYLGDYLPAVEAIYASGHVRLLDLNVDLIRFFFQALGVQRQFLLQTGLRVNGRGAELLLSLSRSLDAAAFLTLPSAEKYLDPGVFAGQGIRLLRGDFSSPIYPQLWGGFRYNLSFLDLLLNCGGAKSAEIILGTNGPAGAGAMFDIHCR